MRAVELPSTRTTRGRSLSLRANFTWTFLGNAVYAGCQWGMLVVLAKLVGPEQVGAFALALAITAPIQMCTNLQLRGIQATDARREYRFVDYLGLRVVMTTLGLATLVGIVFVTGYRGVTAWVILAVGVTKGLESISDVVFGLLQQHERMDRIAVSFMLKGILALAALGTGVVLTGSVLWGAVGLAAASAVVLGTYDLRSGALVLNSVRATAEPAPTRELRPLDVLRPNFDRPTMIKLAWLAFPLGIVMMLGSLNTNIPRYFVEHYLGSRNLGIFAAMAYLMVAGGAIVNALGQSASPRLSKYYAAGNAREFSSLLLKLEGLVLSVSLAGIVIGWLAGRWILTLLYRPEYAHHADVLVWLIAASGVIWAGSFLGYGLTAARHFRVQMPLVLVVTVTTVLGCVVLVPHLHLLGAAWALLLAGFVQLVASVALIGRAVRAVPDETSKRLRVVEGQ